MTAHATFILHGKARAIVESGLRQLTDEAPYRRVFARSSGLEREAT